MGSRGTVEGSEATFTYDDKSFTYRLASGKEENTIENERIVGFLPRLQPTHELVLLYVDVDEAKDKSCQSESSTETSPVESCTLLRSLRMTDPPESLFKDYGPGSLSWLQPSSADQSEQQQATDTAKSYHRVTVIISTHSGSHSAEAVFKNLLEPFMAAVAANYHVLRTSSADTITAHTRSTILPNARQGRPQTVILLSGDGGPVDIINALLAPDIGAPTPTTGYVSPTLALLPLGTGNALAHSTLIAASRTIGLSTLLRGTPAPLPLFRATLPAGSYALDALARLTGPPSTAPIPVHGAVVLSWALHASLVADSDTDAYRAHGAARFQMAAKENLFPDGGAGPPHVYRGTVTVSKPDGQREVVLGHEHSYVLVTLVSNLEERFCVSPESRPMDGKLRVVRLPPMEEGGKGVMRAMELAYQGGKHVEMAEVGYEEVEGVRIKIEEGEVRWRRVCVDGKIYVVAEGGEVDVTRAEGEAVKLVVLGGGRGH